MTHADGHTHIRRQNSNILNRKQFCVIIMCYVAVLSHSDAISNSIVCSYGYDILQILTVGLISFVDVLLLFFTH